MSQLLDFEFQAVKDKAALDSAQAQVAVNPRTLMDADQIVMSQNIRNEIDSGYLDSLKSEDNATLTEPVRKSSKQMHGDNFEKVMDDQAKTDRAWTPCE